MRAESPSHATLFLTYLCLMVLLALTAWASSIQLAWLGTSLSLAIAALKATLILLFFMHLYYRTVRLRTVALASLLWLFFLFGITLADYATRGSIGVIGK